MVGDSESPEPRLRRGVPAMIHDLRYGVRMLRRSPGVSILAIPCLTLAIGANATVFSWIEGILLRLFRPSWPRTVCWPSPARTAAPREPSTFPGPTSRTRSAAARSSRCSSRTRSRAPAERRRPRERAPASMVSANYFDALEFARSSAAGSSRARTRETLTRSPSSATSCGRSVSRRSGDRRKTQPLIGLPHTIVGVAPRVSSGRSWATRSSSGCRHRCRRSSTPAGTSS